MKSPTVALSLRQPWAYVVVHCGKRVENRRWNTNFRGPFLIHASKGMTRADFEGCRDTLDDVLGLQPDGVIPESLLRGGIMGMATIVDVVRPRPEFMVTDVSEWYPEELREDGWRWHFREQFGFVLRDVRPLPFVPCRGSLGFFKVPTAVLEQIEEAA